MSFLCGMVVGALVTAIVMSFMKVVGDKNV